MASKQSTVKLDLSKIRPPGKHLKSERKRILQDKLREDFNIMAHHQKGRVSYTRILRSFAEENGAKRFYELMSLPVWSAEVTEDSRNLICYDTSPLTERYSGELQAAANKFREVVLRRPRW